MVVASACAVLRRWGGAVGFLDERLVGAWHTAPRAGRVGLTSLTERIQSAQGPQNWKITLAYDGTDFKGWQVQPGEPTIQGELQAALGRITGESPLPQGSGRTDAGVHALAQVASFALQAPIPEENLVRALNRTLPLSIRVLAARTVRSTFHARHSAVAKTYEYWIFREAVCSPFLARYVYPCLWPLDVEVMAACARVLVGEHDFASFAATDPERRERSSLLEEILPEGAVGTEATPAAAGTVKTIFSSEWELRPTEAGELLVYRVRGNGFLHHMVRNLVSTMIEAGRGCFGVEAVAGILAARSRAAAGPTAPARGLFLHSVEYDEEKDDLPEA